LGCAKQNWHDCTLLTFRWSKVCLVNMPVDHTCPKFVSSPEACISLGCVTVFSCH
jgi:hypothetical protein